MHAIKIESNKKLPKCPDGFWLITEEHSPEEKARRQKLNIEVQRQTDEWNELQKTHRYVVHDMGDQHDDCNRDQLDGQSLEEIANCGNIFAKRLVALTADDPFVKRLVPIKKFSVNDKQDFSFSSSKRPNEFANDFIGISDQQFAGEFPCGSRDLVGIDGQESLDRAVQKHLDSGSVPPDQVGVVMKSFAASICSRLEDGGDSQGLHTMLQRAQKAWKLIAPYISEYSFNSGRVDIIPPKNPLLGLMSRVDPEWMTRAGSAIVEEFNMMMNGDFN